MCVCLFIFKSSCPLLNVFPTELIVVHHAVIGWVGYRVGMPFPIWTDYKGEEMRALTRASTTSKKNPLLRKPS